MIFPPDKLAEFKKHNAGSIRHEMGSALLQAYSLRELLAFANQEQLQQWEDLQLPYASDQGDEELRTLISAQYPGLQAKNIVTFCGAQEAIFVSYHALLSASDAVLCVEPIYFPLRLVPQGIGASVSTVSLKESEKEWTLDLDEVFDSIKALKGNEKLFAINFPHNPTGAQLAKNEFESILECASDNNTWVLSDEVFRGLESEPDRQLPTAASCYEKGISIGVMSKAYALGGIRVGWLASQDEKFIQRVMSIKSYLSICGSKVDELLSKIALSNSSAILQRNIELINANVKVFEAFQKRCSNICRWIIPEAGFLAFPRFVTDFSATGDSEDLIRPLMNEHSVSLIPGKYYSSSCQQHFRLGLGLKSFQQDLNAFEKGIESILAQR
ncbi:pyridoxal phosphate-dependent aminotransferase [Aurantivibrio infirmus]